MGSPRVVLRILTAAIINGRFYDSGYHDGFEHGRIHGMIEGRALGREKGYEMWEELGFYEGFALMWKVAIENQGRKDEYDFLSMFVLETRQAHGENTV